MSTSAVQIEANRANAQQSTGPRTDEGKQRSSQNSLKHGVTAKSDVLRGENPDPFKRFGRAVMTELGPQGELEIRVAQNIVSIQWRLLRVQHQSDLICEIQPDPIKQLDALNKLAIYEQRLTRTFQAAMKQLRELQQHRGKAASVKQIQKAQPVNGFVFSNGLAEPFEPFPKPIPSRDGDGAGVIMSCHGPGVIENAPALGGA